MHWKDTAKCHWESVINSSSPFSSVSWLLVFVFISLLARNLFSPLQRRRTGSLSSYIISSDVLPFTSSLVFQLGRSCTQLSAVQGDFSAADSRVSHLWVSHTPQHVVVSGTRHIGLGKVCSKLVWLGCNLPGLNCRNSHLFLKRHVHIYIKYTHTPSLCSSLCVCTCHMTLKLMLCSKARNEQKCSWFGRRDSYWDKDIYKVFKGREGVSVNSMTVFRKKKIVQCMKDQVTVPLKSMVLCQFTLANCPALAA